MLLAVQIDLSDADLAVFDGYEDQVLPLLARYGARMEERIRATDGSIEIHLLRFPDQRAHDDFLADPGRAELQPQWEKCGARSRVTHVVRLK